jgi:glycosyltransferase involved in cell wall biosynthesis
MLILIVFFMFVTFIWKSKPRNECKPRRHISIASPEMKILHLSKMDTGGGAADGFMRIHTSLLSEGIDSFAYVMKHKRKDIRSIIHVHTLLNYKEYMYWIVRRLIAKLKRILVKPIGVYDFDEEANFPADPIIHHARKHSKKWDIVMVHWSGGFVSPETISHIANELCARIVLWQVDMAHATAGCHSTLGCEKYKTGCGACPLLKSRKKNDISSIQAEKRRRIWMESGAIVISQSGWSAQQANTSYILKNLLSRTFPIPLNLSVMCPTRDITISKKRLGINTTKRILLVRGIDPKLSYKGFHIFLEALRFLDNQAINLHVVVLGEKGLISGLWNHITFTELGPQYGDVSLAYAYQACDFFVSPSINDAGPMMVGEALSCGLPVIAFPIGIASDLISSTQNGHLVNPIGDSYALAAAIKIYIQMSSSDLQKKKENAAESASKIFSSSYFKKQLKEIILN